MRKYVHINKMQCGEVSCKIISSFEEAQKLVDDYIDMLNEEQTNEIRFEKINLKDYFSKNSNYNTVTLDDGSIIEVIEIER